MYYDAQTKNSIKKINPHVAESEETPTGE